ncbi:MAG: hypothetical protein WCJ60_02335 [bacterium]
MADPFIELDVNDIVDDVEQVVADTTAEVSSTEENKTEEVATEDKTEEASQETEEEAETKEEEAKSDETEDEKPKAKNEANTRIRTLANENRELRQQVEQLNAQAYKPASEQELVDAGYSETDAKVEALRQDIEVERFNRQVTELNYSLQDEARAALNDFPVFNPNSDQYNETLAQNVADLYQQAAGVQTDPNTGLVVNANVMPYNFYKTFADTIQNVALDSQVKGQKANERMLAAVDAPSSAAPKEAKVDPFLQGLSGGKY